METNFGTETHIQEFDLSEPESSVDDEQNNELLQYIKIYTRYAKKQLFSLKKLFRTESFNEILYVTLQNPPFDFISAFRNQYPNKEISVLMPISSAENYVKLNLDFEVFLQNETHKFSVYKIKNKENIKVYGIYSKLFESVDCKNIRYISLYAKAVRSVVRRLKPSIVHADNFPFFLGSEFEKKLPYYIKVLQVIDDFSEYKSAEAFWAAMNLAGKKELDRICNDKIVKKCLASLFYQQNAIKFSKMDEYLDFLYENYDKFREKYDENSNIEENIIINRLNARILKMFPKMNCGELHYNLFFNTIKNANYWVVTSKTYYNDVISNPDIAGVIYDKISKLKEKSSYVSSGYRIQDANIYKNFNSANFRDYKIRNKKYLVREFSKARIKIKFVASGLFENEDYILRGYLDSFYDAPLIFCQFSQDIFRDGADIALTVLLKFFEQYKNIQIIINIPNGLKNSQIAAWVEFLEKNGSFDGKWLFIDGLVNLEQFYAGADLSLFPSRNNIKCDNVNISMRYGCIPVTTKFGRYNDSVSDIFDDMITGRGFKANLVRETTDDNFVEYYNILEKALNLYNNNHSSWNIVIENAINYNPDWTFERIENYFQIYDSLK